MKMMGLALWTHILIVLGVIRIKKMQLKSMPFSSDLQPKAFRKISLAFHSQEQNLKIAEWSKHGKLFEDCAATFVRNAVRALVCTIAQFADKLAEGVKFSLN